ncbi:MAG: hypothetical protein HYS27_19600 [Deltaproteobacteria bacterium]|nr:hypothetical protein [Deltaproteobacteria bacterium]
MTTITTAVGMRPSAAPRPTLAAAREATPTVATMPTVRDSMSALEGRAAFAALTGTTPARTSRATTAATTTVDGGVNRMKTLADFQAFAKRDDVPGAAGVQAVKFFITGVDTGKPKLWLLDGNKYAYHYDFATRGLGQQIDLRSFNAQTYFTDARKNVAGTIVLHDSFVHEDGKKGLFAVEFWPTDPVKASHVNKAFDLIAGALPFAKGRVAYHPAGDTQEALAAAEASKLKRYKVPVVSTEKLFAGVTYNGLNPGVGFGRLKVVDGSTQGPLTVRDVVLFKNSIPNDISHVGGIITEVPQTPLSHINLKAQQNKMPNAFIKGATSDPAIAALVGKLVRYEVGPNGYTLKEATKAEADAWLEAQRPTTPQAAPRDLSKKHVVAFDQLGAKDATAFGAKTANLAELKKLLPAGQTPDGFGIPFSFYDQFMKDNGLYDEAKKMMAAPGFKDDPAVRERALEDFRKKLKKATVPAALEAELTALQAKFPAGQPIRCRSSTNNEDLEGFNGAGLYDSYTHRPNEGNLSKTVKQTWASLWNFRAFEERDFWRIDHMSAAMAVTVHPNQDDELANGVAITKNIYDENWPGFYVNAQVGESLVTNPDPSAVPEEMLVSAIGPNGEYEVQRLRKSSLANGKPVLTDAQLKELVASMEKIQEHFKRLYRRQNDPTFAMDIEFKITKEGKLSIKQARPTVK